MKKQESDLFRNIGIALFVFLTLFFVYFTFNNTNHYKDEISSLETLRDSLNEEIQVNYINKDSIDVYLDSIYKQNQKVNVLIDSLNSLKQKLDKNEISFVYDLDIDGNIKLFTRLLSKKDSVR